MGHVNQSGDVPGRTVSRRRNIDTGCQAGVLIDCHPLPRSCGRRGDIEHAPGPFVLSVGAWAYPPLVPEKTSVTAEPLEGVNWCPLRSSWPFSTMRTADCPNGALMVTSPVSI